MSYFLVKGRRQITPNWNLGRLLRRRLKTIWWNGCRYLCEILRESQAEEYARGAAIHTQLCMGPDTDGMHARLAAQGGVIRVTTSHAALALCRDKRAAYETEEEDAERQDYANGNTTIWELMEVNAFMTLEEARVRPDKHSVAAVGTNWVDSVCDTLTLKQQARFSKAARRHVSKTIAKKNKNSEDAPIPCSLENALKGICCKKGAMARARAVEEKRICLLGKLPAERYKRSFKRVQAHNGGGPYFVFQHLVQSQV